MSTNNVELMEDVLEQATDRLRELEPLIIAAMVGPNGAFGNHALDRAQRIEQFLDDARMGAIDVQRVQTPWRYNERVKQFREDMAVEMANMNEVR